MIIQSPPLASETTAVLVTVGTEPSGKGSPGWWGSSQLCPRLEGPGPVSSPPRVSWPWMLLVTHGLFWARAASAQVMVQVRLDEFTPLGRCRLSGVILCSTNCHWTARASLERGTDAYHHECFGHFGEQLSSIQNDKR